MTWPMPIEFWFELASPYAWLSAHRIEGVAASAGVEVVWRPFLLGPIFKERGYSTSPMVLDPDREAWMWQDIARSAADLGMPFRKPRVFPSHTVLANRVALVAVDERWAPTFVKLAGSAAFSEDADLGDREVIRTLIRRAGHDPDRVENAATLPENKERLRRVTEEARVRGVFGAPTFFVGEERFWGNDRMSQAFAFAVGPNGVLLDEDDCMERLHFAFRNVIREPDRLLEARGLRRLHHQILYMCRRHEPLRSGDLGVVLGVTKQALHGPLTTLREQGLVELVTDPNDGRARHVILSAAGREFEDRISGLQREMFRRIARNETPAAQLAFLRMLEALGEGQSARSLLRERNGRDG